MSSRYKPIEVYEYDSTNRTNIKILNHDGSEYMTFSHNEIKSLKMNLKTGIFYFVGNIFGAPKELKLNDWKRDRNNIIKKIVVEIVKNGFAKRYAFNCGIQTLQEDYKTMSYLAVFRHDNIELPMFHTVKMFDNELVLDIKIDKTNISFKNVSKGTAINLGLNAVGLGLGIIGVAATGSITIPVVIALGIGASSYGSATYDFIAEVTGQPELKGQGDFLQQLSGEIGKIIGNQIDFNPQKAEEITETGYSSFVLIYGLIMGRKSANILVNTKSYKISKAYEHGYVGIKKIILKSSTNATQFESGMRKFNKALFINDATNTISAGKSVYDKIPNR